MPDDLTDGVKWCIEQGLADPARVGIYGASYGGYAVLAGLTLPPERYACGVNYVGGADLERRGIPRSFVGPRVVGRGGRSTMSIRSKRPASSGPPIPWRTCRTCARHSSRPTARTTRACSSTKGRCSNRGSSHTARPTKSGPPKTRAMASANWKNTRVFLARGGIPGKKHERARGPRERRAGGRRRAAACRQAAARQSPEPPSRGYHPVVLAPRTTLPLAAAPGQPGAAFFPPALGRAQKRRPIAGAP